MFDGRWRTSFEKGLKPVGANIRRTGITADHLTASGVVLAGVAAVAIANGALRAGLLLLVLCRAARPPRRRGRQGLRHRRSARRLLRLRVGPRHRRAPARRRRLVPLVHAPRADRGAPARRPRRVDAHLLRAGQGRVARLRCPRGRHGARRADHRPRVRPPVRLPAHPGALADARPHPHHRGAAVHQGLAAGQRAQARAAAQQPLAGPARRSPHRAGLEAPSSLLAPLAAFRRPRWWISSPLPSSRRRASPSTPLSRSLPRRPTGWRTWPPGSPRTVGDWCSATFGGPIRR